MVDTDGPAGGGWSAPGRPAIHPSYGLHPPTPDALLPWSWVVERMTRERNYWVGTTKPSGAPHVMPVWGVWVDDAFYFGTGRESVKARNLRRDARASVHLESGDDVVIMEGTLVEVADAKAIRRYSDACEAKYAFQPVPPGAEAPPDLEEPSAMTYVLIPQVVFAWAELNFPESATRWERET